MSQRHIEISGRSVDNEGNPYQELSFKQYYKDAEKQKDEQVEIFPAVIGTLVKVMSEQK